MIDWPLVIEFEPPAKLLNMNDRMHYQARARLVKQWRAMAFYAAVQALPGGPAKRRLPDGRYSVQVFLPVKGHRQRDPSNAMPTVKACIDGALGPDGVHGPGAGLLPDDSEAFVTVPEPVLVVGASVVRIEITPLSSLT